MCYILENYISGLFKNEWIIGKNVRISEEKKLKFLILANYSSGFM